MLEASQRSGIQVKPQGNSFGAEVTNVDLTRPLNDDALSALLGAWAQHSVVFFPEQELSLHELESFTRQFGEFGADPYIRPIEGHPNVLELRREANEKAKNFGSNWHSDWSFQEKPPAATILHSRVVPPVGGDTIFVDCYRAYEELSPAYRDLLDGLIALHSAKKAYGPDSALVSGEEKRSMSFQIDDSTGHVRSHPLVRVHDVTQRKALYVSPVYTVGIEGMADQEASSILDFLYKHMTQEKYIYRHKWKPNMILLWDNRCTLHNAEGGYDGHLRVMHRTTVAGGVPKGIF
ncbi:TauD/TfdA family dioxygenase [Alcaligenaceae bacterium]|nr:TauD/TfdA family dioxygenase [Alcaligenaceae bacterium]